MPAEAKLLKSKVCAANVSEPTLIQDDSEPMRRQVNYDLMRPRARAAQIFIALAS